MNQPIIFRGEHVFSMFLFDSFEVEVCHTVVGLGIIQYPDFRDTITLFNVYDSMD